MATIRVKKNIWGNYACFVGSMKDCDFGTSYDAANWLSEMAEKLGASISPKSDITAQDLEAHLRSQAEYCLQRWGK